MIVMILTMMFLPPVPAIGRGWLKANCRNNPLIYLLPAGVAG
jgi:hypothetical protein